MKRIHSHIGSTAHPSLESAGALADTRLRQSGLDLPGDTVAGAE